MEQAGGLTDRREAAGGTASAGRGGTRQAGEARRGHAAGESEWRHAGGRGEGGRTAHADASAAGAGLILRQHGVVVGEALGGVGGGDGVDDGLGLLVADL